ncbi:adp-ribosylation factor [Stylonychia lemnae]|uniref:Adp-ribosylation factor n=1 Tax=Stylonychia lemnae TaxID=5949 RepID=A0A078ASV0_STYLE|nr:adp-ribosylation factor [Stylonychia lemnae]|eukprot:CDW85096.1 adp-ribosylation factor [Stylonychia lemnae]
MGNWFTNVWDRLFNEKREFKLVIIGLDAAGKTTILNKMRFDEYINSAPTIGVNTEDIQVKNINIKVFDLAGQEKMRNVWKYYYSSIEGIIFVLDSGDTQRIMEAKDEIQNLLTNDEAKQVPILIFANKQDLPNAIRGPEMTDMLGLVEYVNKKTPTVKVQESSAVQDRGLLEGFEWIVDRIVQLAQQRSQQ